ncbi:MAG: dihydroorotase family protein [Candidatus Micrarchaeota archaeon]
MHSVGMLIRGGSAVVGGRIVEADILVEGGKIAKVGKSLSAHSGAPIVDATGLFILPGMVDAHVHLRDFKESYKEDWFSGTSSALAGGVTSVLDMPNNSLPTTSHQALEAKELVAAKKALCDYAFFFGATPDNAGEAARSASDHRVAGLKLYMGPSTGNLDAGGFASVFAHFASFKKPIAVHAENGDCLQYFSDKFDKTAANHSRLRDELCAQLAVSTALDIAERTKARLHVCHVSTAEELELIADAKREGVNVTCEATPHHLFLSDSDAARLGNFAKVNPPLRNKQHVAALWDGLRKGVVDIIATDHAPHSSEEKLKSYSDAPSGMPGLETALPLLLTAVNEKRLSLPDVVRLYSTRPADIYRLHGKGQIAEGFDADMVLVDLKKEWQIRGEALFTKCRWTAFERKAVKGRVLRVFVRGEEAFDGEHITARQASGRPIRVG